MTGVRPSLNVTMSGLDKLMPDVDTVRVYESRLVHQLDGRKVIYCTRSSKLYYWEPENGRLRRAIEAALKSVGRPYEDEAVAMDNLGVFNRPRKLFLDPKALRVVGSALRLMGVDVRSTGTPGGVDE